MTWYNEPTPADSPVLEGAVRALSEAGYPGATLAHGALYPSVYTPEEVVFKAIALAWVSLGKGDHVMLCPAHTRGEVADLCAGLTALERYRDPGARCDSM